MSDNPHASCRIHFYESNWSEDVQKSLITFYCQTHNKIVQDFVECESSNAVKEAFGERK